MTSRIRAGLGAACFALCLSQGCGSKAPKGVPEVPECRHAADAIAESKFDTGIDHLRRQADVCRMYDRTWLCLDQAELNQQIEHVRQVENAKWQEAIVLSSPNAGSSCGCLPRSGAPPRRPLPQKADNASNPPTAYS
jgi:hypothetical protein